MNETKLSTLIMNSVLFITSVIGLFAVLTGVHNMLGAIASIVFMLLMAAKLFTTVYYTWIYRDDSDQ